MIASSSEGLSVLESENLVYQERTLKMQELEAQMMRNAEQDAIALNNMAQSQAGYANLDMAVASLVEALNLKDLAAAQASATILNLAMNMEHGAAIADRMSAESLAQLNFALTVFGQRVGSAGVSLGGMNASLTQAAATMAAYREVVIPTVAQLDAAQSSLTESVNALLLAGSANMNIAELTTQQGAAMAATLEAIAVKYQTNTVAIDEYQATMDSLRQSYADGAISAEEYSARASAAEAALAEARRQSTEQMQAEVIDAYTARMTEIERSLGAAVHVEEYYVQQVSSGLNAIKAGDAELAAARIQNAESVRSALSQTSKVLVEEYLAAAEQQKAAITAMVANLESMISTLSKVESSAGGAAASLKSLISSGLSSVKSAMSDGSDSSNQYTQSLDRLKAVSQTLRSQQSSLASDLGELNDKYRRGQISASEFAEGLDSLKGRYSQVTQTIQEGNSISEQFANNKNEEAKAAVKNSNALSSYGKALNQTTTLERGFDQASRLASQGKQKAAEDLIKYKETLNATDESIRKITDAMTKLKEKTEELAASTKSELFKDAGLDAARDKLADMAAKMSDIKAKSESGIDLKLNADAAIATGAQVRSDLSQPIYTDWFVTKKVVGDDGEPAPSGHRWGGRIGESKTYGGGDKVPALLEKGEFVIRKEMVRRFGEGFFHGINRRGSIPKFASGGLVGGAGGGDYSTRIRELEELFEQLGLLEYTQGYKEVALDSPEGAASAAQSAKGKESALASL
jgi:archaellum component FlaC